MQHVSANADLLAAQVAEMIAQRQQIEQALRRVLVHAVAGVDDVRLDPLSEKLRRAGRAVPDDHHVDPHRFEILRGIDQGLALGHAGAGGRDVHRIRGEPLLGELEGDPRAGGVFEEQVDDRGAAQRRDFLDRALADLLERLSGVENELDLLAGERLETEQIFPQRTAHALPASETITQVLPSHSSSRTSTRWPSAISTFFPTMSAWIGSSRPPRSTRTASAIRAGLP